MKRVVFTLLVLFASVGTASAGPSGSSSRRTVGMLSRTPHSSCARRSRWRSSASRHEPLVAACVVAYVFSPIDPIPDFIPVLGLLDELVVVPLGVALVLKMVPPEVLRESRERADRSHERPISWVAAGFIVAVWLAVAACAAFLVYRWLWALRHRIVAGHPSRCAVVCVSGWENAFILPFEARAM